MSDKVWFVEQARPGLVSYFGKQVGQTFQSVLILFIQGQAGMPVLPGLTLANQNQSILLTFHVLFVSYSGLFKSIQYF